MRTGLLGLSKSTASKTVISVSQEDGLLEIQTDAVIFAMGCRERPRGAITILGIRPAGVITAGAAQKMININGYRVGVQAPRINPGEMQRIVIDKQKLNRTEPNLEISVEGVFKMAGQRKIIVCIFCPLGCEILAEKREDGYKIEHNKCTKGKDYAFSELTNPVRHVTSTIALGGDPGRRLPVRTNLPVPKDKIFAVIREIKRLEVKNHVSAGQVFIKM